MEKNHLLLVFKIVYAVITKMILTKTQKFLRINENIGALSRHHFNPEVRKKGTALLLFEKTVKSYIKKKDFRIFVFANYYSSLLTANREIQVKLKKTKALSSSKNLPEIWKKFFFTSIYTIECYD